MWSYTSKFEGGGNLQGSRRKKRVAGDEPPTLSPCLHYPHIYLQPYQHLTTPWFLCFSYFLLLCPKCLSLLTDVQHTTLMFSLCKLNLLCYFSLFSSPHSIADLITFSYCPVLLFKKSCLHLHLSLSLFLKEISPQIFLNCFEKET